MIVVKLVGGLGNQMFQYAAARALALVNNTTLKLDIRAFEHFPDREYALNEFSIDAEIANGKTLNNIDLLTRTELNIIQKIRSRNYLYIQQNDFSFNSDIVKKYDKHIYLDGYWQSENYFLHIGDIIRKDFSLDYLAVEVDSSFLTDMDEKNAVSVHVRRGDYVSNHVSNDFHGVLGLDYYKHAMHLIESKVQDPYFFLFSDDIDWCRKNFKLNDNTVFVENRDHRSVYKDLYMMTRCKHHIIANSSFSWWGAWLGKNKQNKIVVAPENWFNKDSKLYKEYSISTRDIVPVNWTRI